MIPSSEVLAELTRLYQVHGELTPRIVLDAATEEGSPLHNHFEWDYELAGEAYRLVQAGELIRKARVRIILASQEPPVRVRAFISITTDDKRRVYRPQEEVAENADMRAQALEDMERDWKSLRRKWQHYSEFWQLVQEESNERQSKATTSKRTRPNQVVARRRNHTPGVRGTRP